MKLFKKKNIIYFALSVLMFCLSTKLTLAQDRYANIENKLKSLAVEMPGLEQKLSWFLLMMLPFRNLLRGLLKVTL